MPQIVDNTHANEQETTLDEVQAVSVDQDPVSAPPRRMNPLGMLLLMVFPLVLVAVLGWALIESDTSQPTSGLAPDFTLRTYVGDETITLSSLRGKVVIVNFWASWCPPCREEAPELNTLYEEYRNKGLVIIGVGYLDNFEAAMGYLNEFGVTFPTGHDDGTVISKTYRIKGVPETFIIDKNGDIRKFMISNVTARQLRPLIDQLLAEPLKPVSQN